MTQVESIKKQREAMLADLLREADRDWFSNHSGTYAYDEQIKFVAAFIARHYDTRFKRILVKEATQEKKPRPIAPVRVKSPAKLPRTTNKGSVSAKLGRR